MRRSARAGAIAGLAVITGGAGAAQASAAVAITSPGITSPAITARPAVHESAHPSLRALPTPVTTLSGTGANAHEVNAVAELVETMTPGATVRSVSRKGGSFIVKAVASSRTQVYRVPASMIQAAPPGGDAA